MKRVNWHRTRWIVIGCALLIVLAAIGCSSQVETLEQPAVVPPVSDNPGRSAAGAAEISGPDESPVGEPSPTRQLVAPAETAVALVTGGTATPAAESGLRAADIIPPTPTPTPTPAPIPTPSPSPTPMPELRQITTGGCCTQPFWSPDSRQVLFIDRPAPGDPVGIWGVDVSQPNLTPPQLVTDRIAFYTADLTYRIELSQSTTVIERLAGPLSETVSARWTVPAGGRPVSISPGRKRVAWQVSNEDLPFERRTTQVWVANLDGSDARSVATLPRGGFSDWISDDVLLMSSRESLESREQALYTFSLVDGRTTDLVRAERLRGGLLSPDRAWLAYYIALDEDPAQNGLWLVRTDGTGRRRLALDLFGAYQWRDSRRLLIIPFRPEAVFHELWELDVETGETRRMTNPEVTPFKIANGDWTVSPDGRYVAFVESGDQNIWLLTLMD
jgi:Tol biopolymer transport system component